MSNIDVKKWSKVSGVQLNEEDFAREEEDRLADLLHPIYKELIDISKKDEANKYSEVKELLKKDKKLAKEFDSALKSIRQAQANISKIYKGIGAE